MIPEAAVEAALNASLSFKHQRSMDNAANHMRHILEAAAPHMRQAFCLEMNLRAVQDELRATPIYPLGKKEDKR